MSHSLRWISVAASVVLGGTALGLVLRWSVDSTQSPSATAAELARSDPQYRKVMCGPVSLSTALGRLGVSCSSAKVAAQCRVTEYGVAMTDLETFAKSQGSVTAGTANLVWGDLTDLDGVAVLFVRGNHFLTVDPRETKEDSNLRLYEPEKPARWISREELEEIWKGEALVLSRTSYSKTELDGPQIEWKECFIDKGVIANALRAEFEFSFRNTGTAELVIEAVKTSCGCIDYKVTSERLKPGESGLLTVNVNLKDKEGYVHQYVALKTNDLKSPVSMLNMSGGIPKQRVISSDVIRVEDLPQGGTIFHEFFVADPGFSGCEIRETSFVPESDPTLNEHLTCSIASEIITEDFGGIRNSVGFRTVPGDYLVKLSIQARNDCPVGPFTGLLNLELEAGGHVTSHNVRVVGTIVPDVFSVPRVALITLDPTGSGSATMELQSYANRSINVRSSEAGATESLTITKREGLPSENSSYVITARMPDAVPGAAPVKKNVSFELDHGTVVTVPVAIFMPPQTESDESDRTAEPN